MKNARNARRRNIEAALDAVRWLAAPIWLAALLVGAIGFAFAAMALELLMPKAAVKFVGDLFSGPRD